MSAFKIIAAAAALAVPLLLASPPAEAKTARQYQEQGRGRYVSSKARYRNDVRGYDGGRYRHPYRRFHR